MKKLFGCFLCVMLLAFGAQAHALMINPDTTDILAFGNEPSQDDINAAILDYIGSSVLLYKYEADTGEDGSLALAGSYETEFYDTYNDPADPVNEADSATIEYISGPIVGQPAYLLVKDGDHEPAWYLFDLTYLGLDWDGVEILELENFWPRNGAISHVSLYGNQQSVPEPATMLLLGFGLIGLAGFGRKKLIKK